MGGNPNPHGMVFKADVLAVADQYVVLKVEKEEDAEYLKGKVGDVVIVTVTDTPSGN